LYCFRVGRVPLVIWLHWFSSDALGTIVVAPLAIGLVSLTRNFPPRREIAEGVLAVAVVSLVCALLVFLPNEPWTEELAIGALCPLLLWIAPRLRSAFTAVATFIIAITIVWTTIFAIGIFGDSHLSIEQRVLGAQATILAITLGALVLAALFSERGLHESTILEREARLQDAWKSAELADRAKSSFLAAAMRQPLQTLKLLQAALGPHHPSGEARSLFAEIGRSLDTMTGILSSLPDVNRLESGNLRPSVSEFSRWAKSSSRSLETSSRLCRRKGSGCASSVPSSSSAATGACLRRWSATCCGTNPAWMSASRR
jgi:hypothetical protein